MVAVIFSFFSESDGDFVPGAQRDDDMSDGDSDAGERRRSNGEQNARINARESQSRRGQ